MSDAPVTDATVYLQLSKKLNNKAMINNILEEDTLIGKIGEIQYFI